MAETDLSNLPTDKAQRYAMLGREIASVLAGETNLYARCASIASSTLRSAPPSDSTHLNLLRRALPKSARISTKCANGGAQAHTSTRLKLRRVDTCVVGFHV